MNKRNSNYKDEFTKHQQQSTLFLGKIIFFIGLPAIIYFVWQDIFLLKMQSLFNFRLIFIIPFIIYSVVLFTILKRNKNLIVYFHSFFLLAFNLSILSILEYFLTRESINMINVIAVLNSYSICVVIIYLLTGISRKFFIPIILAPFILVLFSITIMRTDIDPIIITQFSNPILLIVFLSIYSIINEKQLYLEFATKEELKKANLENNELNDKLLNELNETNCTKKLLEESEAKYKFLTEYSGDVIWILNISQNKFTYMSPAMYELTGFTAEEAVNMTLEEMIYSESYHILLDDIPKYTKDFLENPSEPKTYTYEVKLNCKNGGIVWGEVSAKFRHNEIGEIEILGVTRNVQNRKITEKEVLYLSYHDQLTGLYNRRFYEDEVTRLNNEKVFPLALIMIDLNGLKLTNDAFGHNAGDILLKRVACILKRECRENDIISRIGGDEFVILLPRTDIDNTKKIIKRINSAISNEKVDNIVLSISVGFAIKQDINEDINTVFIKAEDDMYRHKLSESLSMRSKTIDLIMNSLYEKNHRELLHSKRVSELCESMAEEMGLDKADVNRIKVAGLMHDIGKIGVDERVLSKPGKLNNNERAEINKHPEISYRILSSVNEFSKIADYVLEHHERWDGAGYPKGIKGEEISLEARIIAVADAFDAMTTDRPYCCSIGDKEALNEIRRCAGTQFDPSVVKVFIEKVIDKKAS